MSNQGLEFLIDEGVASRHSPQQEMVVGCLACRWSASGAQGGEPTACQTEIVKCTGIGQGATTNILQRFATGGATKRAQEYGPTRTYYGPADSELGAAFLDKAEIPGVCGLEDTQTRTERAVEAARAARQEAMMNIINNSSAVQLGAIVAQATERIEQLRAAEVATLPQQ